MPTEAELRSVCEELAAEAHSTEYVLQQLDRHGRPGDNGVSPPRRRRLAPLSAAAAVIVAVALIVVLIRPGTSRHSLPPSSGLQITCIPSSGQKASPQQLEPDRRILLDRLSHLGVRQGRVSTQVAGALVITVPTSARAQIVGLCADHPVELRPLIAPATPIAATTSSDPPLSALPFKLPTSESAYEHLSRASRLLLTAALEHASCAALSPATLTTPRIICDTTNTPSLALLTGPAITDGTPIATASAVPPDVSVGLTEWTVAITFKPAARSAWSAYTTAHNTAGRLIPQRPVTACGHPTTPCADYVAFIADGSVVSLPVNVAAITGGTTQISGNFTQATAATLAAHIGGGQLPVPLLTASIRPIEPGTSPTLRNS